MDTLVCPLHALRQEAAFLTPYADSVASVEEECLAWARPVLGPALVRLGIDESGWWELCSLPRPRSAPYMPLIRMILDVYVSFGCALLLKCCVLQGPPVREWLSSHMQHFIFVRIVTRELKAHVLSTTVIECAVNRTHSFSLSIAKDERPVLALLCSTT
jgi:hypothetical protein